MADLLTTFHNLALEYGMGNHQYQICRQLVQTFAELAKTESWTTLVDLAEKFPGFTAMAMSTPELVNEFARFIAERCQNLPLAYKATRGLASAIPLVLTERIFGTAGDSRLLEKVRLLDVDIEKLGEQKKRLREQRHGYFGMLEAISTQVIDKYAFGERYTPFWLTTSFEDLAIKYDIINYLDRVMVFNGLEEPSPPALTKELAPYWSALEPFCRQAARALRLLKNGWIGPFETFLTDCRSEIMRYWPAIMKYRSPKELALLKPFWAAVDVETPVYFEEMEEEEGDRDGSFRFITSQLGRVENRVITLTALVRLWTSFPEAILPNVLKELQDNPGPELFYDAWVATRYPKLAAEAKELSEKYDGIG